MLAKDKNTCKNPSNNAWAKSRSQIMYDDADDVDEILEAVVQRCSIKSIPKNFTTFTEKHLYQSLFLNKVTRLRLQLY